MKITAKSENITYDIPVNVLTFSGGEQHVKINTSGLDNFGCDDLVVYHEMRSSSDVMTLLMLKDALDNLVKLKNIKKTLVSFYIPYGRQDRVCEKGEAFSLKAFAKILNSMHWDSIITADPHSDVTEALIENLQVIPQHEIVREMLAWRVKHLDMAIVSPDGGALKKIFKVSKELGGVEVFCAEKVRDTATGNIVKTDIHVKDFAGRNLLVVDDLCDGGRTFIELAKVLKEHNCGEIELYVTHGIFSKGLGELSIDFNKIHCFNAWQHNIEKEHEVFVSNQAVVQNIMLSKIYY